MSTRSSPSKNQSPLRTMLLECDRASSSSPQDRITKGANKENVPLEGSTPPPSAPSSPLGKKSKKSPRSPKSPKYSGIAKAVRMAPYTLSRVPCESRTVSSSAATRGRGMRRRVTTAVDLFYTNTMGIEVDDRTFEAPDARVEAHREAIYTLQINARSKELTESPLADVTDAFGPVLAVPNFASTSRESFSRIDFDL